MSSATQTGRARAIDVDWTSAGIAGIVGGVAFDLLIQFAVGAVQAVGALVGAPNVAAGWILHMALSMRSSGPSG